MERNWLPEEISATVTEAYDKYHHYLLDFARRRGCTEDVAEDLVHEVFIVVLENPKKFLECRNKAAWLFSTMKHRIEHLKRDEQYALRLQTELEKLYTEGYENQLSLKLIYGGIISEKDLELLIHYSSGRCSYNELSKQFGMEPATCRKHVQRARERLRKALEEEK